MHLRWTEAAAADLERIADYLLSHAPDRAPRLLSSIYEAPEALLSFPHRGRPGKKAGTRELVLSPFPLDRGLHSSGRRRPRCSHPPRSATMAVNNGAQATGAVTVPKAYGAWRAY